MNRGPRIRRRRFNRRRKKIFGRGNRKNALIRVMPPLFSTKPQKYGPGSTIRRISTTITIPATFTFRNLGNTIFETPEFIAMSNLFEYYKIYCLKIIFLPHNYVNNIGRIYFQVNWDNNIPSTDSQLTSSDKTKIVGSVNSRTKVFKFLPPNGVSKFQDQDVVQLNSFIPISNRIIPLTIVTRHTIGDTLSFTALIEMVVLFRGASDSFSINNKLNKINLNNENKNINLNEYEENEKFEVNIPPISIDNQHYKVNKEQYDEFLEYLKFKEKP